jgi:hypothetical protein
MGCIPLTVPGYVRLVSEASPTGTECGGVPPLEGRTNPGEFAEGWPVPRRYERQPNDAEEQEVQADPCTDMNGVSLPAFTTRPRNRSRHDGGGDGPGPVGHTGLVADAVGHRDEPMTATRHRFVTPKPCHVPTPPIVHDFAVLAHPSGEPDILRHRDAAAQAGVMAAPVGSGAACR